MKNRPLVKTGIVMLLSLIVMLMAACQTPTPTPAPVPTQTPTPAPPTATPTPIKKGRIAEATMTRDVDIAQRPTSPADTFSPTAVIYVSAKLAEVKKGSQVSAKWYSRDDLILSKDITLDDNYDSVYASFNITRTGDKPWPEGPWRVDLYLDNNLEKSVKFTVASAAATATPTVRLTPYQDTALGFSLGYPAGWKVTRRDDGVDLQKPGAMVLLLVRVIGGTGTLRELSDSFIQGVKETAPDLEIVKKDEITDDQGVKWAITGYTYRESGIKLANTLITTVKGGRTYFVVAVAPFDTVSEELDATLGPMMDTIRLQ